MIQQRVQLLFQQGKLRSDLRNSMGRDAAAVAFVIDLRLDDTLCLWNGDLVPAFVKGASLEEWFRASASNKNGDSQRGSPDHLAGFGRLNIVTALNAAEQIGAIRQLALAAKRNDSTNVVVVFPAPRPQLRARWDAAMKLAGSKGLPVVFVVHGAWKTDDPSTPEAFLNGIPAISVDGSDAVAAYRVACEAIVRARQRRGPSLVECVALSQTPPPSPEADRIHLQTGTPFPMDSSVAMKDYLKLRGLWSEESYRQKVADIESELDLATRFLND